VDPASRTFWDSLSPYRVTGLNPGIAPATTTAAATPALSSSSGPGVTGAVPLWSPQNPFFWFGAVAAVTIGLIGANAHLRVGSARVGADVGKA
jgi:hypothetical protein